MGFLHPVGGGEVEIQGLAPPALDGTIFINNPLGRDASSRQLVQAVAYQDLKDVPDILP